MNTARTILARLALPFAIDLRTLALFRVCFGMVILVDLVIRALSLTAHYTDLGVLPRGDVTAASAALAYSPHMLGGSAAFQGALLVVQGLLACLLIIGYRTRWVTIASWIMLVSLNHRNLLITQTSDTLMLALLFWAIFLPLGARFSVDAALNTHRIDKDRVCSLASAALIVQVLSVYFFGALLKTSEIWLPRGDAVYFALHFSTYSSQIGSWLGDVLSFEAMRNLTYFVWYIEFWGPILVLLPFFVVPFRLLVVPLLMLMHVGFAVLLNVGIYPYLSITSLLVLIPSRFWEFLGARFSATQASGLTIYYDQPCGFCRKICLLLRTFLLLGDTPVEPAARHPQIQATLEANNSWVVEDAEGQRHVRWAAMIVVIRHSPLFRPLAGLLTLKPALVIGEWIYSWVANHRDRLSKVTAWILPYHSFDIRLPLVVELAVGALMCIVVYGNMARLTQVELRYPSVFHSIAGSLWLVQNWTMFAPAPGRTTTWLYVEGVRPDGTKVDAYNNRFEPPSLTKPKDGSGYFDGYRWRKYFNAVSIPEQWERLGRYYCWHWNDTHPEMPIERVIGHRRVEFTKEIWYFDDKWSSKLETLGAYECRQSGKP